MLTKGRWWVCLGGNGSKWLIVAAGSHRNCKQHVAKMLLTGTYHRSVDDKQRFSIPKPIRDALTQTVETAMYLTPGTDGSIALYPEAILSGIGDQLGRHSPNSSDVRTFSRLFYAQAQRVDLDRQGRMRIPMELVTWAGIEREITLLGVRDHLEIWSRARWNQYLEANQFRFDEFAEQATRPREAPIKVEREVSPPARPR